MLQTSPHLIYFSLINEKKVQARDRIKYYFYDNKKVDNKCAYKKYRIMKKHYTHKLAILILLSLLSPSAMGVNKHAYDFVVGVNGDFKAAKKAAEAAGNSRYYIFFPNGSYDIGSKTGDSNQMTTFNKANVSLIGQSMDGVTLYNTAITEGISTTATLYLNANSKNTYMQDLTLQNMATVNASAAANRYVALMDRGDKNIYMRVKLQSTQDTYYSTTGNYRSYWEDGEIHGTVDFICGGGDILFNKCLLYLESRAGNVITAPAGTGSWGYVFRNCTIDGYAINSKSYRLGRAWSNSPRAVYINTTMKLLPTDLAWGDPMNTVPKLFAEYNSMNASGTAIDLSKRRTQYSCTKDGSSATIDPSLSASEAANYTISNVMKGSDNWRPDLSTRQVSAPAVTISGNTLKWNDNDSALCYVLFKDGVYVTNITATSYSIPDGTSADAIFTVRAANEFGGLGAASKPVSLSAASDDNNDDSSSAILFYYGNGTTSNADGNTAANVWTCTDTGLTGYSWAITGKTGKAVLYGANVAYKNNTYSSFKNSNGAQNTFTLPAGVKAKKLTLIGYTNDSSTYASLSEVNGIATDLPLNVNLSNSNYATSPASVSYTFSNEPCGKFTFTVSNKQVCFIILLETEEGECSNTDVNELLNDNAKSDNGDTYDTLGRKVKMMKKGVLYIRNGKKFKIE